MVLFIYLPVFMLIAGRSGQCWVKECFNDDVVRYEKFSPLKRLLLQWQMGPFCMVLPFFLGKSYHVPSAPSGKESHKWS